MSDSELDDLHQSILTLCGKDSTILKAKEKEREAKVQNGINKTEKNNSVVPDSSDKDENGIGDKKLISSDNKSKLQKQMLSQSESSFSSSITSINGSDYDTVDEASCSDMSEDENDLYTTTIDKISTFNSTKHDESSQLYHTVDETVSDIKKCSETLENKLELKDDNPTKLNSSLHLSPIKDVGNESRICLSTPCTPSMAAAKKCPQFAQSTPLNKLAIAGKAVRQVENESSKDKKESKNHGRQKTGKKNKSMFEYDESDFSDMSFDDLLIDTFTMCKGNEIDWKLLFMDANVKVLHPNIQPPDSSFLETECKDKLQSKTKTSSDGLSEWKMLYGDPNSLKTLHGLSYSNVTDDSAINKTLTEENTKKETLCSEKSEINSTVICASSSSKLKETGKDLMSQLASNTVSSDMSKNVPSTSKPQDQNISKIKVDSIFDKQAEEKDSKQKATGRFSNFTSSFLSDIEVTEDESEHEQSEDILGLNNFTYSEADDIDLDEEDEATLLDETITDLPESIKNKYKVNEVTILSKSSATDANITVIENKEAVIDVNKNFMKQASETVTEAVKTESEEKEPTVKTEIKEDEETESAVKVEIKEDEETDHKEKEDLDKITGKIDYEAERKYFDIECPEVREIINMWGSKGIQDPNTNLSFAKNLRSKDAQQKGMLEGNHISCIWLKESADAGKECSSPMKKRQKLDSQEHTRRDIERLEEELDEISVRHHVHLRGLFQEWKYEKVCLEDRHRPVFQQLKYRQLMEMKENYEWYRNTNIPLFQMNVIRLHAEHGIQQEECKARFNADIAKLEHLFQRREVEIERNFTHRKAQLESLIDQIRQVKSDGKYGHHVTAQFVKGPCRSNKQTRSLVEVYVPAEVAGCILKEDEIIDSFYKYA